MSANNTTNLVEDLEEDSARSILNWFANNQMQPNVDCNQRKFYLSTNEKVITKVDSAEIENNQCEKQLGITFPSGHLPAQSQQ